MIISVDGDFRMEATIDTDEDGWRMQPKRKKARPGKAATAEGLLPAADARVAIVGITFHAIDETRVALPIGARFRDQYFY